MNETNSPQILSTYSLHLLFSLIVLLNCSIVAEWLCVPELCSGQVESPPLDFPSSWNPVGSGARALGMGGAFIAVADDATAASWNPGGLIQLEHPEISIVGSDCYRKETNTFLSSPEGSGLQTTSYTGLNFLSVAYPFNLLQRNMVVALTYQDLYNFSREWNFNTSYSDDFFADKTQYHINNDGSIGAIGLSYSVRIFPSLSAGMTLNFWNDFFGNNKWKEVSRMHQIQTIGIGTEYPINISIDSEYTDEFSFKGFNTNWGLLWNVTEKLAVGAVFKTPFTADLGIESFVAGASTVEGEAPIPFASRFPSLKLSLDMPASYGIGFAYRFNDALTVSADLYRTEWNNFVLHLSDGTEESPLTGLSPAESAIKPTLQARVGFEYLFIKPQYVIPLRSGLFYDPAPSQNSPDDIFGFSFGTGLTWKQLIFDIAYQFRWGNRDIVYADHGVTSHNHQSISEHTIYSSLIIHF